LSRKKKWNNFPSYMPEEFQRKGKKHVETRKGGGARTFWKAGTRNAYFLANKLAKGKRRLGRTSGCKRSGGKEGKKDAKERRPSNKIGKTKKTQKSSSVITGGDLDDKRVSLREESRKGEEEVERTRQNTETGKGSHSMRGRQEQITRPKGCSASCSLKKGRRR